MRERKIQTKGKKIEVSGSFQVIFKSRFAAAISLPTGTSDPDIKFDQDPFQSILQNFKLNNTTHRFDIRTRKT